jgi:alkanesulfonate monooxygenase SsuD/methylene tetrahydromethanopterin reductase-like flavin-dependent oxidoreductase (luciferase family)
VTRLAESLEIVRRLWSGDVVDFAGEHFTLTGAQQLPTPTGPIPITIGGVGTRTLALVREHADWWNLPIHELERLDELRDQVGDARVSVQAMVALVPDEARREDVTQLARKRFGMGAMGRNLAIGTAEELVGHFDGLAARGVERFHVWFADFAPPDTLERFAAVIAGARSARPG